MQSEPRRLHHAGRDESEADGYGGRGKTREVNPRVASLVELG
jgi:hypothetical protein